MNQFSKSKIISGLAAIFVAGVITGVVLSFMIARHLMPNEEKMTKRWTQELETKLNLSAEQLKKIEPVIRTTMTGFKTSLESDVLSAVSNCNSRIVLELTPEQKIKFEQLEREQRDFIQRKFGPETNATAGQ